MRKVIVLVTILVFSMGLFGGFKKEKKIESSSASVILGMVLLEEPYSFDVKNFLEELENKWQLKVKVDSGDRTYVLEIDDYNVAIAELPMPIPGNEVKTTAEYNYFWKNGIEEATRHKGHIIVSITNAEKNFVKENVLFTKVASSILNNSKSLGIHLGGRTLLLKKSFYLENTELMSEEDLPLYNWIYFGLRKENDKQSIYTYGLTDFNKKEMEIIASNKSLEELLEMMYNLAHYVVDYDVMLKNGETIGLSVEQKLKITESKGKYLDGQTLKIEY
jgi:hypothetical protein